MFFRWSSFVYHRRRFVLALSGLSLIIAVVAMAVFGGTLSSSGFVDSQSESAKVNDQLAVDFGRGRKQMIFIFDAGKPVSDPSVRAAVEDAIAPLKHDPRVAQVLTA
jgi:predicted RND superfamily exporter protein